MTLESCRPDHACELELGDCSGFGGAMIDGGVDRAAGQELSSLFHHLVP